MSVCTCFLFTNYVVFCLRDRPNKKFLQLEPGILSHAVLCLLTTLPIQYGQTCE